MSFKGDVRARTIAMLWWDELVPFYRHGIITRDMIRTVEGDLNALRAATQLAREEAAGAGQGAIVPRYGWSLQQPLELLLEHLRREGPERGAVPNWEENYPTDILDSLLQQRVWRQPDDGEVADDEVVVPGEVVARIGAGRAVKLIELFYATVLRQPELQIYFDGTRTGGVPVDVDELRNHFLQFVVVAFGGGTVYKDMPLRQALALAHKKLDVSRAHYRLTIGIFVTAMHAVRPAIDEATVRAVIAGIRPFESFVVSDGELPEDDDET